MTHKGTTRQRRTENESPNDQGLLTSATIVMLFQNRSSRREEPLFFRIFEPHYLGCHEVLKMAPVNDAHATQSCACS